MSAPGSARSSLLPCRPIGRADKDIAVDLGLMGRRYLPTGGPNGKEASLRGSRKGRYKEVAVADADTAVMEPEAAAHPLPHSRN